MAGAERARASQIQVVTRQPATCQAAHNRLRNSRGGSVNACCIQQAPKNSADLGLRTLLGSPGVTKRAVRAA